MRTASMILAAVVISSPVWAQSQSRGNPQVLFEGESIDEMIAAFMVEHDVPGMSLAIVQAPYITRAVGYGVGDRQLRTLVSANTVFDIAGMKGAFTAVAAIQLVEQGKLQLEAVLPLIQEPSEHSKLEGLVAEASGQSYQQFVRGGQFDRIGLKHTFFASELPLIAREELAPGARHQRFLREPSLIDPTEPAAPNGAGGAPAANPRAIYSSASDVSIWDIALAGNILVKDPALRKLLYEPAIGADGVRTTTSGPWFFPGRPGLMIATGSAGGFSSLLSRFTHRDELLCVTLLANREGLDLTQLARRIAGAYNARLGPPSDAAGMRAQQSPYSVNETVDLLQRVLQKRGVAVTAIDRDHGTLRTGFGPVSVWEKDDQVWIVAARVELDRVLLEAITPQTHGAR